MKKGRELLHLFLYASLVSLVWLGSYVLMSDMLAIQEENDTGPIAEVTPHVQLPETVGTQWSVLVVADENAEVTRFFLRYADFLTDRLVFMEVPVNTKVELETGGYEVLLTHNPELPEIFMISDLCRIFSEETWCMAAEEVGVALLGTRPAECYVIDREFYNNITETVNGKEVFKESLSVKETIVEATEQAVTDDTAEEELLYWESYLDIKEFFYKTIPGKATPEEFQPEIATLRQMAEEFRVGVFNE